MKVRRVKRLSELTHAQFMNRCTSVSAIYTTAQAANLLAGVSSLMPGVHQLTTEMKWLPSSVQGTGLVARRFVTARLDQHLWVLIPIRTAVEAASGGRR